MGQRRGRQLVATEHDESVARAKKRLIREFGDELRQVWIDVGKPPYRRIERDLESVGVHYGKSTIGEVLTGARRPAPDLLRALASYFQQDPDQWAARLADLDRRLDALVGRSEPEPAGRRGRIVAGVGAGAAVTAALAGLLIAHPWTPRSDAAGQQPVGHQPTSCYVVYRPDARLLDAANVTVGEAAVGSHFVSQATTDHPYPHRRYGLLVETGQRGWIDEAKIRSARETCGRA